MENDDLNETICTLWNVSRTALALSDCSRHSRMIYVRNQLRLHYPSLIEGMSNKRVWFAIEEETGPIKY